MKKPKLIGITGGIGSGKSTIARGLSVAYGIPVFYADQAAKIAYLQKEIISKVKTILGDEAYNSTDDKPELNLEFIRKAVADREVLQKIEAIIHPEVRNIFMKWQVEHQSANFLLYEAAILIETGNYEIFDKIVLVTAPEEERIARVIKRDGVSKNDVLDRIRKQWTDFQKADFSDIVVYNENNTVLKDLIGKLHFLLLKIE